MKRAPIENLHALCTRRKESLPCLARTCKSLLALLGRPWRWFLRLVRQRRASKKRRVHSVTQAWKDNKVCRIIEETYSTNLLNTPIQVHLFNPRMYLKLKGCFFSVNYYYRFKGRESCYRRFFLNSCQNCPPYLHRLAVYDADCTLQGMSTILPWKATLWTRATWRRCACKNGHYTNPRRRERERERERAYSIWMIMWKIRFLPERREIRYFGY